MGKRRVGWAALWASDEVYASWALVWGASWSEVNSRPCLLPQPPTHDSLKQLLSFSFSHSYILHCSLYPCWCCLCSVISPGGFIRPYKFNTPLSHRLRRKKLLPKMSERSCPVSKSVSGRCPAARGRASRSSSRVGPRGCSFSGYCQPGDLRTAFEIPADMDSEEWLRAR